MKTAIILFALAIAAATAAMARSYERQSDALKACFAQSDSSVCMINAGWVFCPHCAVFGTMLANARRIRTAHTDRRVGTGIPRNRRHRC
jgi:hypothetical protein